MNEITEINSVAEFNRTSNHETLHPLVSVVDVSKSDVIYTETKVRYGLYCILLKEGKCNEVKYGRNSYDYEEGTLVFFAPNQLTSLSKSELPYAPKGYALVFHPDLLLGTSLAKTIHSYSFFEYENHEALHLSEQERQWVVNCLKNIQKELQHIDIHSKELVVSNIELFLKYCKRFYDRQFITREPLNKSILSRFDELLESYFAEEALENGLPSVGFCADKLHLSSNYFGDLIKKETGKSAKEYIQQKVIDIAKIRIFDEDKSINKIAYELGFQHPQNFTRFFKQKVGISPSEYREAN